MTNAAVTGEPRQGQGHHREGVSTGKEAEEKGQDIKSTIIQTAYAAIALSFLLKLKDANTPLLVTGMIMASVGYGLLVLKQKRPGYALLALFYAGSFFVPLSFEVWYYDLFGFVGYSLALAQTYASAIPQTAVTGPLLTYYTLGSAYRFEGAHDVRALLGVLGRLSAAMVHLLGVL